MMRGHRYKGPYRVSTAWLTSQYGDAMYAIAADYRLI